MKNEAFNIDSVALPYGYVQYVPPPLSRCAPASDTYPVY